MKTQEMAYTGQAELNIVMQEDITEMDEVVVTGYQNIKKRMRPVLTKPLLRKN